MDWTSLFHELVIPFLGGFALTLGKLVSDRKLLSFDEANDIALDLVLVGVGALGALYIRKGAVEATIDAGVGDVFLASVLLYIRHRRNHLRAKGHSNIQPVGVLMGATQLALGAIAIVWTIKAF